MNSSGQNQLASKNGLVVLRRRRQCFLGHFKNVLALGFYGRWHFGQSHVHRVRPRVSTLSARRKTIHWSSAQLQESCGRIASLNELGTGLVVPLPRIPIWAIFGAGG